MRKVHTDIFVLTAAPAATAAFANDDPLPPASPFPNARSPSLAAVSTLEDPVTEVRPGYAMHFVAGDARALRVALLEVLSRTVGAPATNTASVVPLISQEALHSVMQGDVLHFSVRRDTGALQVTLTPFNDADDRLAGVVLMSQPGDEPDPASSGARRGAASAAGVPTMTLHPGESAAERLRRELLAVVSHELRSPLSSIRSWTHVLQQSLQGSDLPPAALPQADRALAGITAGVERQVAMVDTLIDAARVLAGDVSLCHSTFRLGEVVENTLRVLAPALAKKRLTVARFIAAPQAGVWLGGEERAVDDFTRAGPAPESSLESSLDWLAVTGDVERVTQVVAELLENAVKFSVVGGAVRVRIAAARRAEAGMPDGGGGTSLGELADAQDPFVALSVENDGVGIAPASLPDIFRTFAQVDQSSTRRNDGFGLGLPVARRLIELHGGALSARSDGENQGACFTMLLPARREPRPSARPPVVSSPDFPSLAGVAVMVIDDQEEVRESLAAVLEQSGAEVLAAESGRDAIALLDARGPSHEPDVLICDIAMPEEDGYVTLLRIREWEANRGVAPRERLSAIAVTAFSQREDRDRALSRGYALHFAKPVDPTRLLGAVATLAGK